MNDRLAVWRLLQGLLQGFRTQRCKGERPLSGLETGHYSEDPSAFVTGCKGERPLSGLETPEPHKDEELN